MSNPFIVNRRRFAALAAATTLAAPMVARGQARWKPEKPITIYNPFAAGGVTDVHVRLLGETVSKVLGQQVVVDIKAGATGTLAPAIGSETRPRRPNRPATCTANGAPNRASDGSVCVTRAKSNATTGSATVTVEPPRTDQRAS